MRFDTENLLRRLASGQITVDAALAEVREQLALGSAGENGIFTGAPAAGGMNGTASGAVGARVKEEGKAGEILEYLRGVVNEVTQIERAKIDADQPFERFGIDSILVTRLNRVLEEDWGELSKTLFFEYRNLRELADYFVKNHREAFAQLKVKRGMAAAAAYGGAEAAAVEVRGSEATEAKGGSAAAREDARDGAEPIAIIGMFGRYPMAEDLEEFWDNLKAGRDCVSEIPKDRWDGEALFDPDPERKDKCYTRWGGFLKDVDKFDARLFNISPRQAELMDPQERLFLETAWATLEDAGYTRANVSSGAAGERRKVGVFVGVMYGHYQLYGAEEIQKGNVVAPLSAYWSVANRVSYFFNLEGPSLAVDTACSSSLTALHLACESIRRGESDLALAGGVNLSVHPLKYHILSQGKFASSDGRCRSFGAGGDGYVPGEGVGAVLLKPLSMAVAEGDHIYGVIRGSAINHGGKTNGYTVPNPNAQGNVVADALRRGGIEPGSISYVEAHGTGTALGDPIELTGLALAFGGAEARQGICAIGSVKSNVGHLEAAAGIAALAKVLLQMKHGLLVPTLHSSEPNPNLNLGKSPFRLQHATSRWDRLTGTDKGKPVNWPRRAGISSFGAGGSNAHLVVEEHVEKARKSGEELGATGEMLVVLSAQKLEVLKQLAVRLRGVLEREEGISLRDLAFTLQTGREALCERVAFRCGSRGDLARELGQFINGEKGNYVCGRSDVESPVRQLISGDQEGRAFLESLVKCGNLGKAAELWVNGVEIDWLLLPANRGAQRVSLPTYPFARERYWIPTVESRAANGKPGLEKRGLDQAGPGLHPLIDRNESTLSGGKFVKRFSGEEWYFRFHRVAGVGMLPAACYLEMALAAGQRALEEASIQLSDVTWARAIQMGSAVKEVAVEIERAGAIRFRVTHAKRVHAQGRIAAEDCARQPEKVDWRAVKSRLRALPNGAAEIYEKFRERGLEYGRPFQVIGEAYVSGSESLCQLVLGAELRNGKDEYRVHPALLDGAFQSMAFLAAEEGWLKPGELFLPFSVKEMRVYGCVPEECQAWVRPSERVSGGSADSRAYDISMIDPSGTVLVEVERLVLRRVTMGAPVAESDAEVEASGSAAGGGELFLVERIWEEAGRDADALAGGRGEEEGPGLLMLWDDDRERGAAATEALNARRGRCGRMVRVLAGSGFAKRNENEFEVRPDSEEDIARLVDALSHHREETIGILNLRWLAGGDSGGGVDSMCRDRGRSRAGAEETRDSAGADLAAETLRALESTLVLTRVMMEKKFGKRIKHVPIVGGSEGSAAIQAALAGFGRSVQRENPRFGFVVVMLERGEVEPGAIAGIWEREWRAKERAEEVRYEGERRRIGGLRRTMVKAESAGLRLRRGGVYLITGGAGGIGLILAEHLARKHGARLILMGRSELDDAKRERIARLEESGGKAIYVAADVSDADSLREGIEAGRRRFGAIEGVIHAAGILEDGLVLRKQTAALRRVMKAKADGLVHLDLLTRGEPLDFFVACSSMASIAGNVGQADYAAANGFMDGFLEMRAEWVRGGKRQGHSVSIHWPLWRDGGMRMPEESFAILAERTGLRLLEAEEGCRGLEMCLAASGARVGLVAGAWDRLSRFLGVKEAECSGRESGCGPEEVAKGILSGAVAEVLKLNSAEIDFSWNWEEFGFDSVTLTEFANRVSRLLEVELAPADLFEHSTLNKLLGFLVETQGNALSRLAQEERRTIALERERELRAERLAGEKAASGVVTGEQEGEVLSDFPRNGGVEWVQERRRAKEVAIVGMSGTFPGSADLEEFWEHLKAARDLITEIPGDRFDWRNYFGNPQLERNKTDSKWGGFLREADRFDAAFFRVSPQEAELMDPQQRLLLELAWLALEDSGHRASKLSGSRTGVFVGIGNRDYAELLAKAGVEAEAQFATGIAQSMAANRLSHFFDFRGPSEPVDTACSSSLVAVHRAVRSLQLGECDLALAGGVNLIFSPTAFVSFGKGGLLSKEGRCKTFDRRADGYVRGEGGGILVLKPVERARADGDFIYAVIRGTAVNHGGKGGSLTAPNPEAQAEVYVEALREAELSFADLDWIEVHGTGTALGDPVEINGLKLAAERMKRDGRPVAGEGRCGLGTVKTNIGHLETAAGVAGIIKVLLAMREGKIPGNVHLQEPNPYIELRGTPFYLVAGTRDWERRVEPEGSARPRRAGVSSFGFGGVNAHLILEEYLAGDRGEEGGFGNDGDGRGVDAGVRAAADRLQTTEQPRSAVAEGKELVVLSARTEAALNRAARQLAGYLERCEARGTEAPTLRQIAWTLQTGREEMEHRLAAMVSSRQELLDRLREYAAGDGGKVWAGRMEVRKRTEENLDEGMAELIRSGRWSEVAARWVRGAAVRWEMRYGNGLTKRVPLPGYAFERKRYWFSSGVGATEDRGLHPLLDAERSDAAAGLFFSELSANDVFVRDHVLQGQEVVPAAVLMEMVRAAAAIYGKAPVQELREVSWHAPIRFENRSERVELEVRLKKGDGGRVEFRIEGGGGIFSTGIVVLEESGTARLEEKLEEGLAERAGLLRRHPKRRWDARMLYEKLEARGLRYGASLQVIRELVAGEGEALARLEELGAGAAGRDDYFLDPAVLDGALQAVAVLLEGEGGRMFVPVAVERLRIFGRAGGVSEVFVTEEKPGRAGERGEIGFKVWISDGQGKVAAVMEGLRYRAVLGKRPMDKKERKEKRDRREDETGRKAAIEMLKELLGETLKMPEADLDVRKPFDAFGVNSVSVIKLNALLEQRYGNLPKTLFYEYPNIESLAEYFASKAGLGTGSGSEGESESESESERKTVRESESECERERKVEEEGGRKGGRNEDGMIAIVGVSGRYPMARDIREFWGNLVKGRDCITEIPEARWKLEGFYSADKSAKARSYAKWGGFIDDVDRFDPLFFNISMREAELMDPQERLFLETTWAALEDAGYTRGKLGPSFGEGQRDVGVFVGVMFGTYQLYGPEEQLKGNPVVPNSSYWSIANRVSYFFDFQGPSMAVDTACSSSLYAIHLACESLRQGYCRMAVAGGVNLSLHPYKYIGLSQGRFASSDGRCRSFGEGGDGYVPGEGVGAVVLKPLGLALADGDHVYAVIRGSSINHGGRTPGYTVPNPNAQANLIRDALARAGVSPGSISYVEAHGTGTTLGDPIEIAGLNKAWGEGAGEPRCWIGSVKSNIGHLESAAGMAALTKVLWQMRHGWIVPTLHCEKPNPNIDFERSPFQLAREGVAWEKQNGAARRAAISSFGAGGSNAHLILEEFVAPGAERAGGVTKDGGEELLVFSAKDPERLRELAARFVEFLEAEKAGGEIAGGAGMTAAPAISLREMAFTLQCGREAMDARLAVVCRTKEELLERLREFLGSGGGGNSGSIFVRTQEVKSEGERGLEAGPEANAFFEALARGGKLRQLARLWVDGAEVDWDSVIASDGGRRVSLPSYTFARERCWIPTRKLGDGELDQGRGAAAENLKANAAEGEHRSEKLLLAKEWAPGRDNRSVAVEKAATTNGVGGAAGEAYVVLVNGETEEFFKKVFRSGAGRWRWVLVRSDQETEGNGNGVERGEGSVVSAATGGGFDGAVAGEGERLARILRGEFGSVRGVLDFSDVRLEAEARVRAGYGRVALLQPLIKEADRFTFLQFTRNAQAFGAGELTMAGSWMSGWAAMLGAEYSKVTSRQVDVDFGCDEGAVDVWARAVEHELGLGSLAGEVLYRGGERLEPRWRAQETGLEKEGFKLRAWVRERNPVVVVTGGTRGLGAAVARWLVTLGVRKLVVMGVQPLPERSRWEEILNGGGLKAEASNGHGTVSGGMRQRVANCLELERAGAEVRVFAGELTDGPGLGEFFGKIRSEWGGVGGVFHCAGQFLFEHPAFVNKPMAEIARVFQPKVEGLEGLHLELENDALELFVLFSSISAAAPMLAVGASDYAAANHFMDHFAAFHAKRTGKRYLALNWPNWTEAGMGAVRTPRYQEFGFEGLTTLDGLELLERAIDSSGEAVVLPAVVQRDIFDAAVLPIIRKVKKAEEKRRAGVAEASVAEPNGGGAVERLKEIFSEHLKIPAAKLNEEAPFDEFGVDSVLLADLVQKVEKWVGDSLQPALFLEYPTLKKLGAYLEREYGEKMGDEGEVRMDESGAKSNSVEAEGVRLRTSVAAGGGSGKGMGNRIAVIGYWCRFPGSDSPEAFWQNLSGGVCSITEVPASRWDVRKHFSAEQAPGKTYGKWGGFIEGIELFDPEYFHIPESDAIGMDPLERQFLEVAVQTFRRAGYARGDLSNGKVGVFAGSRAANFAARLEGYRKNSIIGIGQNFIAAYLSDFLNLRGPNLVVDTACSSSLVAVHLACQSLKSGESEMALAGGVDILLDAEPFLLLSASKAMSPDGKCHTFDAGANGFVPGEGCGAVLLKPLEAAIRDGDTIYGVIEASAVNNDGHTMGVTTPSWEAQREVIEAALRQGGIDADTVSYIETHGTGTMIGDPIELKALTEVFRGFTGARQFCGVGSVKTNIGHLLSAAGIASFMKVLLALGKEQLPPTLHCESPNPRFDFANSPFYPVRTLEAWQARQGLRRAGVSSFGFGGTNCHLVLAAPAGAEVNRAGRAPLPPEIFRKRRFWPELKKAEGNGAVGNGERGGQEMVSGSVGLRMGRRLLVLEQDFEEQNEGK